MTIRLSVVFMGVSILIFGCTNLTEKSDDKLPEIPLSKPQEIQMENLIIRDFIPLETTSFNLMSTDLRIKFDDSNFYVFDESVRDAINKFGRDGSFKGSLATVGEGPNQILALNDFYVDSNGHLVVLSTIGDQSTLIKIKENEPEVLFNINYIASSFTKLSSGDFLLYGSYNFPLTKHRMVHVNNNGEIVNSFLENKYKNKMLPMTERNFFESGDDLFIIEIFNHRVYRYVEKLEGFIDINFEEFSLPSNFWERDIMESFPDLLEKKFASLMGVFSDKGLMLINIDIQGEYESMRKLILIDSDKKNNYIFTSDININNFFHNPIGVENKKIYFYTYQSSIKSLNKNYFSIDLANKIPDKEFDYPVIIEVEFL
ncbi:6-bladed beta-propeller [Algoriphagus sp.]|uniref:6-bladed beta-propeller n=1 Tax=Algoriphagus sp. TaxID=1872435 RepID=UPI00391C2A5A